MPKEIKDTDTWSHLPDSLHRNRDFGYGNLKKIASTSSWKNTYKKGVDFAFFGDMKRTCDGRFSGVKKAACKTVAYEFYAAAKLFG